MKRGDVNYLLRHITDQGVDKLTKKPGNNWRHDD